MDLISAKNLSKTFRIPKASHGFWGSITSFVKRDFMSKIALDDLSFSIKEGELVGYIGPNGAGKSTTIKILSGILLPDEGEVLVLGRTPWKHRLEVVRQIGVVFGQKTQLWWDLQVIESFELLKSVYRITEKVYKEKLEELTEALDLSAFLHTPVRLLSLGQRMRADLAASLLHSPKILFLDEPTIGLDAVSKLAMRDFIRQLNREHGVTILLTTHDMDDIEALSQRVLVLSEGKLYLDGTIEALRRRILPERRLVVDFQEEISSLRCTKGQLIKQEGHRAWISFNPEEIKAHTLIAEISANHPVADLFVENPPIEEIISRLYGEPK